MALALAAHHADLTPADTAATDDQYTAIDLAYKRRLVRRLDPDRAWVEATDIERDEAREKQRFVNETDRGRAGGMTRKRALAAAASHPEWYPNLVAGEIKLNRANYHSWKSKLQNAGGSPTALLRGYRAGAAKRQLAVEWYPEFAEILCRQYFHVNGLEESSAYRNAVARARDLGIDRDGIPSLSQARRYLRRVLGERVQIMLRDPARYRDELAGYMMLKWNCEPGNVWIGDHRILDIFVRHPVTDDNGRIVKWIPMRPWCTAWMDAKSGYMVSFLIYTDTYPNHGKILEALFTGIRHNGNIPPMALITDNGRDYLKKGALHDVELQTMAEPTRGSNGRKTLVQETFEDLVTFDGAEYRHSIARALGCRTQTTAPYKGRQKPIERIFRNFARAFDKQFYGYAGNRPGTRPEEIRDFKGNVMRLLTEGHLAACFAEWLPEHYHRAETRSRRTGGRPPQEVWDSRTPLRAPMETSELEWAMLLPHANTLKVRSGPGGSNVWFADWPYEGVSDADHITLGDMHGIDLMVKTSWAPTLPDIPYGSRTIPARIWLFTLDGRYVAEARPAIERDVWDANATQRERIAETCRKVAVLRRADREAKKALAGTTRIMAPAHEMGWQRLDGPTPTDAGSADRPRAGAPQVALSTAPGSGRGRVARSADEGPAQPQPPPPPDPEAAERFARFLSRRGEANDPDADASDSDIAARMADFAKQTGESA